MKTVQKEKTAISDVVKEISSIEKGNVRIFMANVGVNIHSMLDETHTLGIVVLEEVLKRPNVKKKLEFFHFKNEGVFTGLNRMAFLFTISGEDVVTLCEMASYYVEAVKNMDTEGEQ